ncbi:hypothetical protein TcBrA4_0003290 [Trypanosoma cruzi]|nr:hypothetical protein TcBrA4_0003290 [Trypanosoma cruzi]
MLKSLNISLTADERRAGAQEALKSIMMKFLPAAETLLQMIVAHLPSPKKAQSYRAEMLVLWESGPDDKYYVGIKNCDPGRPLMLYISKMVPTADRGRFFAFVVSLLARCAVAQKVRIMGNNYVFGKKQDLYEDKPVQRTVLMMGSLPGGSGGHAVRQRCWSGGVLTSTL